MLLDAAQILAAEDLETREVEVPEWGGAVRLRQLTAAQRDQIGAALYQVPDDGPARAAATRREILIRSMVSAGGVPLFDAASYEQLLAKAPAPLDRLFFAALDLNGMTEAARERLKNG